jgi:hypothetical protein
MVMVVPENRGPLPRGLECQHPTEVVGVIAIFADNRIVSE